jgi:hypothetical protein
MHEVEWSESWPKHFIVSENSLFLHVFVFIAAIG